MASLVSQVTPLQPAETVAGVTAPASSQPTSGGGPVGSVGASNNGIDSTQSPEAEAINNTGSSNSSQTNNNNTISAAADSSDNQPGTPQPHSNEGHQNTTTAHHPYVNHHIYANSQSTTTASSNTHLNQMYAQHIYSQSNPDLHQPLTATQHSSYPSYLNSYEQFYQQQQQQLQNPANSSSQTQNPQQMDFINSNSNPLYAASEYKHQLGVRYHPYLHAPTSGVPPVNSQNSNSSNAIDGNSQTSAVVSSASSSLMSPRVVSSTSPSASNQMQISGRASSMSSMSTGNPSSPNSGGTPQCKKCGIMCTNESELQEHITNVHGASPYGSSGYASSPYIKEEMQQQTPPSQSQQQHNAAQIPTGQGGNPGEILDLDSQKMLYPPAPGSMAAMMHQSVSNTDPLHGLHSMQQRAGMNSWDHQSQEGLPPYLQQQQQTTESKNLPNHSPYYQSPNHVTNSSTVIKTEYQPIIKNEYISDTQQYMDDKSFDPSATNPQQQMMAPAVSSSPSEFPSTTTGGPPDSGQQNIVDNQQFRSGNFEPPSSSSAAITNGAVGGKAANWKSNEARRPKTYNCTACNKWFTSSGHLKRHYNTTLHKNAVKSSGQPDPATLPISVHHHPARDPNAKPGRRGSTASATNAANSNAQQQQQPPNPVQPPEPPNSPQDYGGPQVATGGLASLPHYSATPSPNSMYQQQQYQQHQYIPQSTTNASPQHASSMGNHHIQHQHQNQQQTVMNGHPNALAGLSVPTTRQRTPMPSSQMRGLLNTTMPLSTVTTMHIIKSELLEAATMEEHMVPEEEVEEFYCLSKAEMKQDYLQEKGEEHNMYTQKVDTVSEEVFGEGGEAQQQLRLQDSEEQAVEALREVDLNVKHHHNTSQLPALSQIQHFQLEQEQPADMERRYHNTTPSNTPSHTQAQSPLIISHQQYQEHLQQQHQMVVQDTYTLTPTPSPPQQLQHNIMERQPYISMPSDINTPQLPNSMLRLQPPLTITEQQQLPPATTIRTTNMVNMAPHSHHMQPPPQLHTELQPLVSTQPQLDTINTNIPSHTTTTNNISIPSFHQLQQQASVLPPQDPTLTYPHTIIGNAEILTLDSYGNVLSSSGHQQVVQTTDGQLVQLISASSTPATSLYTPHSYSSYFPQRSPQEGDLPPMTHPYHQEPTATLSVAPSGSNSPPHCSSNSSASTYKTSLTEETHTYNFSDNAQETPIDSTSVVATKKRKRNSTDPEVICTGDNSIELPDGRVKCLSCNKIFTRNCYLTQHNNSFHFGEYPFRCETCGKRFQDGEIFVIHVSKHTATDKPHKCHICPKQFHHKTDLRRHIDAIHMGKKQHVCDICKKGFCRRDHLRKHIETHNRVRGGPKNTNTNDPKKPPKKRSPKTIKTEENPAALIPTQANPSESELPSQAAHSNDTEPLSFAPSTSAASRLMQQMRNIVDNNSMVVCNGQAQDFFTETPYAHPIQPQYNLDDEKAYEVEEEEEVMDIY